MAAGEYLLHLNDSNYEEEISKSGKPVLVDFWAPWCGPCKQFAPTFSQMAGQYGGQVRFVKVDTEAEQSLAARYNIRSIPTLAIFKGGRELDRVSGALAGPQLAAWLRQRL